MEDKEKEKQESYYIKQLKEKCGVESDDADNDGIKRAIRFRANIVILKMMYEELLEIFPVKYPGQSISYIKIEDLYIMLGTNRTDFSKMYNGHIYEARKKMLNLCKDDESINMLLKGEKLFRLKNMEHYKNWKDVFGEEDYKKQKEKLGRINVLVKNWVSNDGKDSKEESIEYQSYLWLLKRIRKYVQLKNDAIDGTVNEKVQGFRSLTFEQLDECHPYTIQGMYDDIKKVWGYIDCIYQYKCDHKKQDKI